jgi:H/ACA ribonucleoprotein complex subunit 3
MHIRKCFTCSKYSLESDCSCGEQTKVPRPPKFSLIDKYAKYCRDVKKKELIDKNLY